MSMHLFALVKRLSHFHDQIPMQACAKLVVALHAAKKQVIWTSLRNVGNRGAAGSIAAEPTLSAESAANRDLAIARVEMLDSAVQSLGKKALDEAMQPHQLPNNVLVFNAVADIIPLMRARDRVGARHKSGGSSRGDATELEGGETTPSSSSSNDDLRSRVGPTMEDIDKYCTFFYNRALETDHPLAAAHLCRILWPVPSFAAPPSSSSSSSSVHPASNSKRFFPFQSNNLLTSEQLTKLVLHACSKMRAVPIPRRREVLGDELLPIVMDASVLARVGSYVHEYPLAAVEQELAIVARFSTLTPFDKAKTSQQQQQSPSSSQRENQQSLPASQPAVPVIKSSSMFFLEQQQQQLLQQQNLQQQQDRHAHWWEDPAIQRQYVLALLMFVQDGKVMDDVMRFIRGYGDRRGISVALPLPILQRRLDNMTAHLQSQAEAAASVSASDASALRPAVLIQPTATLPHGGAGLPDPGFFRRATVILSVRLARIRSSLSSDAAAALSVGRTNLARIQQQQRKKNAATPFSSSSSSLAGLTDSAVKKERDVLDAPSTCPALPGMFLLWADLFLAMSEREQQALLNDIRSRTLAAIIRNAKSLFCKVNGTYSSSASSAAVSSALAGGRGGATAPTGLDFTFGVLVEKYRAKNQQHLMQQQQQHQSKEESQLGKSEDDVPAAAATLAGDVAVVQPTHWIKTVIVEKRIDQVLRHAVRVHCGTVPEVVAIACRHWTMMQSGSGDRRGASGEDPVEDFNVLFNAISTAVKATAPATSATPAADSSPLQREASQRAKSTTRHLFRRWHVLRVLAMARHCGWLRRAHYEAMPDILDRIAQDMVITTEPELCRWARAYIMLQVDHRRLCESLANAVVQVGTTPRNAGLYLRVLSLLAVKGQRNAYQLVLRRVEEAFSSSSGAHAAKLLQAKLLENTRGTQGARNEDEEEVDDDADEPDELRQQQQQLATVRDLDEGLFAPPVATGAAIGVDGQQTLSILPLITIIEMLFGAQQSGQLLLSSEVIKVIAPMLGRYAAGAEASSSAEDAQDSSSSSSSSSSKLHQYRRQQQPHHQQHQQQLQHNNAVAVTMSISELGIFARLIVPIITAGFVRPSNSVRIRVMFIKLCDILAGVFNRRIQTSGSGSGESALLVPPTKKIGVTSIVTPAAQTASVKAACVILRDISTKLTRIRDVRVRKFRQRIESAVTSYMLNAVLLHASHTMLVRLVTLTAIAISRESDGQVEGAAAAAAAAACLPNTAGDGDSSSSSSSDLAFTGALSSTTPSVLVVSGPSITPTATSRLRSRSRQKFNHHNELLRNADSSPLQLPRAAAWDRPPPSSVRTVAFILANIIQHVHRSENLARVPWDVQLRAAAVLVKHCKDIETSKKLSEALQPQQQQQQQQQQQGSGGGDAGGKRRELLPRLHLALDAVVLLLETSPHLISYQNQQHAIRNASSPHSAGTVTTELQMFFWSRNSLLEPYVESSLMQKLRKLIPKSSV